MNENTLASLWRGGLLIALAPLGITIGVAAETPPSAQELANQLDAQRKTIERQQRIDALLALS